MTHICFYCCKNTDFPMISNHRISCAVCFHKYKTIRCHTCKIELNYVLRCDGCSESFCIDDLRTELRSVPSNEYMGAALHSSSVYQVCENCYMKK